MDRRSWLWRRKSSEKSPGETDSSGGSLSSHSERFSDDQIYSNQSFQSPEITSKAELQQEESEDGVKILSQKLSEAILNISIKEDLVKEHSKVAEEAVEGWEKAEKEVLALRQQIDVLTLRNSTLEDRICHLDGALKECLRQLRQTREENEAKMDESFEKKTYEKQICDLRSQLQSVKKHDPYVETLTKQISDMKLELASMAEELEMRFIEKELSNQAAEQASKLHLESVKKATKFESECRRLNAALEKALAVNNDQKDSLPIVKTNEFESNRTKPKLGINLFDDFLEMEKLVSLPKSDPNDSSQSRWVEMEKKNVEIALRDELETSRNELKVAKSRIFELESLLTNANDARETTEKEVESVKAIVNALQERLKRSELDATELKSQLEVELTLKVDSLNTERALSGKLRAKCQELEGELESLNLNVDCLKTEVEKECALSNKMEIKCQELENELESSNLKVDYLKTEVEKERALSNKMGIKCRELENELESLNLKVDCLETEVEKERVLSNNMGIKCQELENELESLNLKIDFLKTEVEKERVLSNNMGIKCQELENELESLNLKIDFLKTEVEKEHVLSNNMVIRNKELENELKSVNLKVDFLKTEVEKERALSNNMGIKCQELETKISRLQIENQCPKPTIQNPDEISIKLQDTDLALAGSKFADCQKTIASLNRQLKTLASFEDLLIQ